MNNEIELLKKEIVRVENEIEQYRNKINDRKRELEEATYSQHVMNKMVNEMGDRFSEYLNTAKRKSNKLNRFNRYYEKYQTGLRQVFRSSYVYQMIGRLEDDSQKARNIARSREQEINQWSRKIGILEDELRQLKSKLVQIGEQYGTL